jgi:hypothetical protein
MSSCFLLRERISTVELLVGISLEKKYLHFYQNIFATLERRSTVLSLVVARNWKLTLLCKILLLSNLVKHASKFSKISKDFKYVPIIL